MVLSRTEINIRRLLAKCEFMVDENNEENNWRIEKVNAYDYVYSQKVEILHHFLMQ